MFQDCKPSIEAIILRYTMKGLGFRRISIVICEAENPIEASHASDPSPFTTAHPLNNKDQTTLPLLC
jgi:hypothetical protein